VHAVQRRGLTENLAMAESCVLVIGGGAAGGLLAAHLARYGRRVILAERSSGPHDKVCGEFLSEEVARSLSEMGIDLAALGAIQISAVRLHEGSRRIAVELPFRAYGLSRRILDEAVLASASSFGADVRRDAYIKSLGRRGSAWLAHTASGDALFASSAFLATGKHDLRGWRRPTGCSDLIGFKLHLRLADDQVAKLKSYVELFLFRGGYAGLTLVENDIANLCLVVTRQAFSRIGGWDFLFASLCDMPGLGQRLAQSRPVVPRPLAISAIPYGHVQSGSEGIWRLGDQAAVIPSFCGEGIALAVQSAVFAAQYYNAGRSAEDFQRSFARRIRAQVKLTALLSPILTNPWGQPFAMTLATLAPTLVSQIALRSRAPRLAARSSPPYAPGG
jgi:flavin-dependent dehydrogenase